MEYIHEYIVGITFPSLHMYQYCIIVFQILDGLCTKKCISGNKTINGNQIQDWKGKWQTGKKPNFLLFLFFFLFSFFFISVLLSSLLLFWPREGDREGIKQRERERGGRERGRVSLSLSPSWFNLIQWCLLIAYKKNPSLPVIFMFRRMWQEARVRERKKVRVRDRKSIRERKKERERRKWLSKEKCQWGERWTELFCSCSRY